MGDDHDHGDGDDDDSGVKIKFFICSNWKNQRNAMYLS